MDERRHASDEKNDIRLHFRISRVLKKRMDLFMMKTGITQSKLLRRGVKRYMEQELEREKQ